MLNDINLLRSFLLLTVPLKIGELKQQGGPFGYQVDFVKENNPAKFADQYMYGSSKERAMLVKKLSNALAVLAFQPGGIHVFGLHFVS